MHYVNSNLSVEEIEMMAEASGVAFHPYAVRIIQLLKGQLETESANGKVLEALAEELDEKEDKIESLKNIIKCYEEENV